MTPSARRTAAAVLLLPCLSTPPHDPGHDDLACLQGVVVGEVRPRGALLQARLTAAARGPAGDVPGRPGWVAFEVSTGADFPPEATRRLGPQEAVPGRDFVVRLEADGLEPGARHHWRVRRGVDPGDLGVGEVGSFRTPPGAGGDGPVRLVVANCMNRHKFLRDAASSAHHALGFPGLEAIADLEPDAVVFAGDCVYYDHPPETRARTLPELRRKWHDLFAQPRMRMLLAGTGSYWMKDDHDHRFNDCDTTGERAPSSALGIATFREQVPVVPGGDAVTPTWRRVRMSRHLEVWMTEGRDHRSPNRMPDGPGKSLWGQEQRAWLERTLLGSDAAFRVLISPTPLVGPDDAYKRDNHTNEGGFRHEGDAFHAWAAEHGLPAAGFLVVCGDRHWKYHSRHPLGVEELSCGALVRANSRPGRRPGDPKSTDPDARVDQLWVPEAPCGGFLQLVARAAPGEEGARLVLTFHDESGRELHRVERSR